MAMKHQNYLNSLWFIAITFLSVGYGAPLNYAVYLLNKIAF